MGTSPVSTNPQDIDRPGPRSEGERLCARKDAIAILVVGNGMVSHRFCEKLTEYDRDKRLRVVVLGEEPRPAYDRVHLTRYFAERSADALLLGSHDWYASNGVELRTGSRAVRIDRELRQVVTDGGEVFPYDVLVLATGSAPFVPPVPGVDKEGLFVYRTIEDLDRIIDRAARARRAIVVGGGLLGLEAARAVHDSGLETHVVEVAPRLMPRQLDVPASALLERSIRALGVHVHLGKNIACVLGDDTVQGLEFEGGERLEADLIIVSAGVRPRDELARATGLAVGPRGGVIVDDGLCTSDLSVFAIGEVALHRDVLYGLVAPGYEMADVLAKNLTGQGQETAYGGGDMSAKLKLLGTDVATFGDPFCVGTKTRVIAYEDQVRGIYKKLVLSEDGKALLGGILVGDATEYGRLAHLVRSRAVLSETLDELGLGQGSGGGGGHRTGPLPDDAQVCSCNNVSVLAIRNGVRGGELITLAQVKACTRAGTGCGGCIPIVTDILNEELAAAGRAVKKTLCEHFAYARQELFQIVAAKQLHTFAQVLLGHGSGDGCEVCKPTIASILASLHNEPILKKEHRTLQDTNDRFLANIQRNGTYSVVPRVPAGEITPDQLMAMGAVAKKYALYTKITGGQRIDLFGARLEDLPSIWEELIAHGFESGHAYGKAMRTVKSCVGSTWCRFGVQDSTAFAIRIENRYKGIRAPHKLKGGVSGCVRECAEARGKDFGVIATEKGWNVYVGGNGGTSPRHAELLVADVDEETAVRYLDRFIMFYIRTADRLTRTSVWIEKMEGGLDHLRNVIVNDSLGLAAHLEAEMAALVGTYECEWTGVLGDPERRAQFRSFANDAGGDDTVQFTMERGQIRPADAQPRTDPLEAPRVKRLLPLVQRQWVRLATTSDVPEDGGIAVRYGAAQIALFRLASRGEWYATQNMCPHAREMVLARGLVGDQGGVPKVSCPLHKRSFDLRTGACLSGDLLEISTFPVRIEGDGVFVELPPMAELAAVARRAEPDPSCGAVAVAS